MTKLPQIKSLAYCGWRGIDYLPFGTDKPVSAFLGENGAGKTTLAIALIYALLPDRKVLNVRPISDIKDSSAQRQDSLMGRIDPELGYAYVAMEIQTRTGTRLVAGINLLIHNHRLHITPFTVQSVPSGMDLFDLFNIPDGEKVYTPELSELKRHAARMGLDCHSYENDHGQYYKALHDAGILPTPMYSKGDRELFARLLETSFLGGISPEIARNLKHYLLPEAKHIPETVSRMHECTEDVLRTRRALEEAKRQLKLVQAAFVSGRTLIANAIAYIYTQFRLQWSELDKNRCDVLRCQTENRQALARIGELTAELNQLKESEEQLKKASRLKVEQFEADLGLAREVHASADAAHRKAVAKHDLNLKGKEAWKLAAGKQNQMTYEELETTLELAIRQSQDERARLNEDLRRLRADLEPLQRVTGNPAAAALADAFHAKTLASQLSLVDETQAKAYEAALHGLTDGIVGIVPEDLRNLDPTEAMPACFWIGQRVPEPAEMTTIGRWQVAPSLGGYTVMSDTYLPSFGEEARKARIALIEAKMQSIETEIQNKIDPAEARAKRRQRILIEQAQAIRIYLAENKSIEETERVARECQQALEARANAIKELERSIRAERENVESKAEQYSGQREQIRNFLATAQGIVRLTTETIATKSEERVRLMQGIRVRIDELRECRAFQREYRFTLPALSKDGLEDPASYVGMQAKVYSSLVKALEDESPERQQPIASLEMDQHTPLRCLLVWPTLLDILKDHVPSSLLDPLGEEMLVQMEARRDNLLRELIKKQEAVRVQARNISMSIQTQIIYQKRQVNTLSELGRDLRFGKVEGIRITLEPKQRMLEFLQKVAEDTGLFDSDPRPMDEILAAYFQEALDVRLQGDEVLDYRAFVDLHLEAKRQGYKDWVPAFSLSGGEAIGAGIAIVLMLFKALATRGDHRPEMLTPVFVMDEINRIDPRGQRVVVDLCEFHGIQLFVTGPEMVPSKNTRMYMLARTMEPEETVIARELRGFAG